MVKTILIAGISCCGKTSVCNELFKRDFYAFDFEVFCINGYLKNKSWTCNIENIKDLIELSKQQKREYCFLCGNVSNTNEIIKLVDDVVFLTVDLNISLERAKKRQINNNNNNFFLNEEKQKKGLFRIDHIVANNDDISKCADNILEFVKNEETK